MSNGKNRKTFFIVAGAIILGIFISISMINMSDTNEYFLSTNVVEKIDYSNGKLTVTTRDNTKSVCIKQTKSTPSIDSLCWVDTVNNLSTISIYEYKTYYIWVKDYDDIITYYAKYNVKNN